MNIKVIDLKTVYLKSQDVQINSKTPIPKNISELRIIAGIKTAPNHSLVELYKRG